MSEAQTTTDHSEIRTWIEARDGRPSRVDTDGEGGILRVDFREPDADLTEISWETFFQIFDENRLAFLHQDRTEDGALSRFNKFIAR